MIRVYHISDFPSTQTIAGKFMLERFESLPRPNNLQWPHKHSFYEVMWLTSGKATNVIDYHQITIEPNTLFFISPGQLHLMSKTTGVTGYSLTFTEEFLMMNSTDKDVHLGLSFLDNSYSSPWFKLNRKAVAELEPVLQILMKEITRPDKLAIIVGNLLFAFLNQVQRLVAERNPRVQDAASVVNLKQFKNLVEAHFKTQSKLPFYSDKLFLTPHRINQICKQVTGKTAGDIIRERVLLEAKRMLMHGQDAIGKISDDLGFQDFSYFSRQFKRHEGITPAAYRKAMSEKYQNSQESF